MILAQLISEQFIHMLRSKGEIDLEQTFNEKCPRCESVNWEISDKHNNCYCKECYGYFSKDDVRQHWIENHNPLTPHERFALSNVTRKPRPLKEILSQFPYRCLICRTKHVYRDGVIQCIEVCWAKVKELRRGVIKK